MSLSKHFITTGVKAMGLNSLRRSVFEFLGTGMMVADLRHRGRLGKTEDLCEDSRELAGTGFEHFARDLVWSCSLPWVHRPELIVCHSYYINLVSAFLK